MGAKKSERVTVEDFMNKRLVTIDSNSSISEAAKRMVENKMSSVVITKNGNIAGIATERDIVKIAAKDVSLDGVTIGSLMSAPLVSISKKASVEELAEAMIRNKVRHMAVTDDSSDIVGITTVTDVARYLKQKLTSKQAEALLEAIYPTEYPTEAEGEKLFW